MGYYTKYTLEMEIPKEEWETVSACLNKCVKCGNEKSGRYCSNCGTPLGDMLGVKEFIIAALRNSCPEAEYALTRDGGTSDSTKWYESNGDIKSFSKNYPNVLFILQGRGEESGDLWAYYAKNGKGYRAEAKITIEPFNEKKLL